MPTETLFGRERILGYSTTVEDGRPTVRDPYDRFVKHFTTFIQAFRFSDEMNQAYCMGFREGRKTA